MGRPVAPGVVWPWEKLWGPGALDPLCAGKLQGTDAQYPISATRTPAPLTPRPRTRDPALGQPPLQMLKGLSVSFAPPTASPAQKLAKLLFSSTGKPLEWPLHTHIRSVSKACWICLHFPQKPPAPPGASPWVSRPPAAARHTAPTTTLRTHTLSLQLKTNCQRLISLNSKRAPEPPHPTDLLAATAKQQAPAGKRVSLVQASREGGGHVTLTCKSLKNVAL